RDEHHGDCSEGADARDRRAQGARRDDGGDPASVLSRGILSDGVQRRQRHAGRARVVRRGQPGADAGALLRHDSLVAGRRVVAADAGADRRRHVDVSRAARGRTPAGRRAPLRDVTTDHRELLAMRDIMREAFLGLYHHRFRAALSMLGISWGIISVVVLLAYGSGFGGALEAGFRGAFSDGTVVTFPG